MATVMPLNTTARPAVSMAFDGLVALGAVRALLAPARDDDQ